MMKGTQAINYDVYSIRVEESKCATRGDCFLGAYDHTSSADSDGVPRS
jgi:hypothetical protein